MAFVKYNRTDSWRQSMPLYDCWVCGNEWVGYGSHCPECGEPYESDNNY